MMNLHHHQLVQRRQGCKQSGVLLDPDECEFTVAEILTELLDLIPSYDFLTPSFRWGAKRRRSAIVQYTHQSQVVTTRLAPPSTAVSLGDVAATKMKKKNSKAASPATPLMFSMSESDDKVRTPSSVSVSKRKLLNKEELTQSFTDLTNQKASLIKEMEAVKRHLDNLKASNMELKNRKQVIIYGSMFQNLHNPHQHHHLNHHQQQQIYHQQQLPQYPIQWPSFITPSPPPRPSPNMGSNGGISVLPDLNLSFEETGHVETFQPSDAMMMEFNVNRAVASAQARKRRMQIYKEKSLRQR